MTARCGLCARAELRAPDAVPKSAGRLIIDRAGLRRALGGGAELADALPVKATGRPGVNAAVVWKIYAKPAVMRSRRLRASCQPASGRTGFA